MGKSIPPGGPSLDLGLSKLLSEAPPALEEHDGTARSADPQPPEGQPDGSTEDTFVERVQRSRLRGDWLGVMQQCESLIAVGDGDAKVRLWWVESQLRSSFVPSSILAAPLETALDQIGTAGIDAELAELATRITTEVTDTLRQGDEPLLAVPLLLRIQTIGVGVSASQLRWLTEIKQELASRPKALLSVSEKGVLASLAKLPEQQPAGVAHDPLTPRVPVTPPSSWRVGALAFLVAIGLGYLLVVTLNSDKALPVVLAAANSSAPEAGNAGSVTTAGSPQVAPSPNPPALPSIAPPSQLDQLLQDVERQRIGAGEAASGATGVREPSAEQNRENGASIQRVALNMSGPLEPPELQELRLKGGEPIARPEHERIDDPNNRPLFPEPRRTANPSSDPGSQFGYARDFRLISRTTVRERPTAASHALEELPAGTKVRVDSATGGWLKLVSKSGQIGYVRRTDALPAD
jgi:hypothetical protein